MNILRACLDWRVLAGLAAAGIAIAVIAPNLIAAAVPLLVVAACPLSMVLMMRMMGSQHGVVEQPRGTEMSTDRVTQLREQIAASRRQEAELSRELKRLEPSGRLARREAKPARD